MEFRQLMALRAVAEAGSFHGAARRLRITQSAISYQIKNLESELGQTLVHRSKPKVMLSHAGRTALLSFERIVAEIDNLKRRLGADDDKEVAGELRIASSILGIVYLYGDIIGDFIYSHPQIEVKVTATESGLEGARQVVSQTADAAFIAFPNDIAQLQAVTLGTAEHVVIAGAGHPVASATVLPLEILRQHRLVRYPVGAGSRHVTDRLFLPAGGYPPIAMESNDTEFIKRTVRLGLGLAIVPSFTVSPVKDPELRVLRVENQSLFQYFGLVCRRDLKIRTLALFWRFCIDHANSILAAEYRLSP